MLRPSQVYKANEDFHEKINSIPAEIIGDNVTLSTSTHSIHWFL